MPEVLRKWMPGEIDFVPFTKELPKDTTSSKAKAKGSAPKVAAPGTVQETTAKVADLKV